MNSNENRLDKHPCFNSKNCNDNARMHLPVAPDCNIQCNFCSRLYDCINESRPGVTSQILTPEKASEMYFSAQKKLNNISVVGFAGPGDSLANFDKIQETVKLIREKDKNILFCLSTNGLLLPAYVEKIVELGFSHITVTVNAVSPEIIALIYDWFIFQGAKYSSEDFAEKFLENQLNGIHSLSTKGVLCKVNTLYIKGINDNEINKVVKTVKEKGAFISNITRMIPAKGTKFENTESPTLKELKEKRIECSQYLKQMYHCRQCRADSVGLLTNDKVQDIYNPEN